MRTIHCDVPEQPSTGHIMPKAKPKPNFQAALRLAMNRITPSANSPLLSIQAPDPSDGPLRTTAQVATVADDGRPLRLPVHCVH